ncbi:MAG: glycogen/starch synthase, partial [Dehalococcoidia bacterium]
MRVLMLGWELPPLISGGLGVACNGISTALRREGITVTFVVPWAVKGSNYDSAHVVGAFGDVQPGAMPGNVKAGSLRSYTSGYSFGLFSESIREEVERFAVTTRRIAEEQAFDIVHAHDWMTCRAGLFARKALEKPLVVHFHSIEHDRAPATPNPHVCDLEKEGLLAADH